MKRSASIELDFEALMHNLSVVRQYSAQAKVIAVIKANAYGHGMLAVAHQLEDKVDALAVACVDEAILLRKNKIAADIIVLQGFHNQRQLAQCFEFNLQPVCHQAWQIDYLNDFQCKTQISCWLKLDTGMHRLGLEAEQMNSHVEQLTRLDSIKEVRMMSHFANADELDSALNSLQLNRFHEAQSDLNLETSLANSAAIMSMPEAIMDWVRPGIMLYGVSPFITKPSSEFGLKPVMTLKSHIIAIKSLSACESLGYGSCWTSDRDSQIAVVAIGYGDGYPRHAKNGTPVLIGGQRCDLVGRVSMDMITVDITDLDHTVRIGDEAVLWGASLDVNEVASNSSTIAYELLCNTGRDQ